MPDLAGHGAKSGAVSGRESDMMLKKQELLLRRFRSRELNLLVTTSVLEEGVDVPRCNLVVRFDMPSNFRSYIQSKVRVQGWNMCQVNTSWLGSVWDCLSLVSFEGCGAWLLIAFVLLQGRARARSAQFCMLVDQGLTEKIKDDLKTFRGIEQVRISEICVLLFHFGVHWNLFILMESCTCHFRHCESKIFCCWNNRCHTSVIVWLVCWIGIPCHMQGLT